MHYSGILVVVAPEDVDRAAQSVASLPGVEVHYLYPDSGRLIAVQESETADQQQDGLRRIQDLAGVQMAALVEHRIDEVGDGGTV
jgi:nitrate reductase NapAB chaperone NapD